MVKTLKKETKIDHHAENVTKVESNLQTIEVLMEDTLFIDGIHGEYQQYHDPTWYLWYLW